jgi:glycosyltransferase involved in cell wall biosynthesis
MSLAIISTHPIQYHAPIYRILQEKLGVPVTVIYGSDFSVVGYHDEEFNSDFAWDTDLLTGYSSIFLSKVSEGGARSVEKVSPRGLTATLNCIKPKAVLLLGYSPAFYRMVFCIVLKAGYPVIFRGETTDHTPSRFFLKALIRDCMLRFIYKKCSRLLYVGKRSYQHFKRLGCAEDKLIFSPYCVNLQLFQHGELARTRLREVTRGKLGIVEKEKVLIFSGKLVKRKGVDLLLRAVKNLPELVRDDVVVLFLGNGGLKESLKDFAQRIPNIKVRFVGFQNQSNLSEYYHAADVLILPSLYSETWGLVVNEALYHGLPCVVSQAVGCAPDLVEPGVTGEIFRTGYVNDLTLAIQKSFALMDSPEIREACRNKASVYNVERAAEGIATAYNMVVEGNKRSY